MAYGENLPARIKGCLGSSSGRDRPPAAVRTPARGREGSRGGQTAAGKAGAEPPEPAAVSGWRAGGRAQPPGRISADTQRPPLTKALAPSTPGGVHGTTSRGRPLPRGTLMPALRSISRVGLTSACSWSSTPVRHSSSISRSRLSTTAATLSVLSWMLSLAWL